MANHRAEIDVTCSQDAAFAYLADFTNAPAWDPSTQTAEEVAPGTYRLVVRFLGRSVPLEYRATTVEPPHRVVFDVTGDRVRGRDAITVVPRPEGSRITYEAEVRITGLLGTLAEPLLAVLFRRMAGQAAEGIRRELSR